MDLSFSLQGSFKYFLYFITWLRIHACKTLEAATFCNRKY
jgi:hypothetical protein